jgi:hypothetical protein
VRRRLATGLVIAVLLPAPFARATTAPSLADRVVIDGVLDEYAADEWVADTSSHPPETDHDSSWGRDNDISRVALTWDHRFLYLGIEGRAFDSFFCWLISNRAGGLVSLEDTGAFRRAIDLPGHPINLVALAQPERVPDVARADDSHPFALVDRASLPAAVSGVRTGPVGFEMAVPWSALSLEDEVYLVAAVTGMVGTGAGDTAPDASARPAADRFARAVPDRLLMLRADDDSDGVPDDGVNPRNAVAMWGTSATRERSDPEVSLSASPRAFAPDRGEETLIRLHVVSGEEDLFYFTFRVYSLEGDLVRRVQDDYPFLFGDGDMLLAWNGRDDAGAVVPGGAYVVVAEWGRTRGESAGRAKTAVVVVR